jgi:hypothetical protein
MKHVNRLKAALTQKNHYQKKVAVTVIQKPLESTKIHLSTTTA